MSTKKQSKPQLQVFVLHSPTGTPSLNGTRARRIFRTTTKKIIDFTNSVGDTIMRPLTKTEIFTHGSNTYSGKHEILKKISANDYKITFKKIKFSALNNLLKKIPKEDHANTILIFRKLAA